MNLHFDATSHTYRIDGQVVPNVTRLIEQHFPAWGRDDENAKLRGTHAHLATALDDRDALDETSVRAEIVPYLTAWRRFKADKRLLIDAIEYRVANPVLGYAGTVDRIGWMRENHDFIERTPPDLFDIKTGVIHKAAWMVQLAGYRLALTERRIGATWVVQLRADTTYALWRVDDPEASAAFLSMLNLYHFRTKHGL